MFIINVIFTLICIIVNYSVMLSLHVAMDIAFALTPTDLFYLVLVSFISICSKIFFQAWIFCPVSGYLLVIAISSAQTKYIIKCEESEEAVNVAGIREQRINGS